MDQFHTRVIFPEPPVKIGYRTKCLFMGSCFSDYIGKIMVDHKFPLLLNPFGTLFNPGSIADNLENLINNKEFTPDDLHYHDGLWLSFSHYTGFSHPDQMSCLKKINEAASGASHWLKKAGYLVLTFGTAWAYHLKTDGKLVANCHKLPANEFTKVFVPPQMIISRYEELLGRLKEINPALQVIFTLSPVRHWSDGAVNNQLSKSVLHYSIQEILKKHAHAHYFPAYEIFMDELRDYRFYASDMLHPSEQGAAYVWERFCDSWLDDPSKKLLDEITAILKAADHRPLNTATTAHKKFQQNTLAKIEQLVRSHPWLDFTREIALLHSNVS